MTNALQLIAGFVTNGAAGDSPIAAAAGDTFTVPSGEVSGEINLEQLYAGGASTDFIRMFSPRMHDNAQGLRLQVGSTKLRPLLPFGTTQALYPADVPTVRAHTTAAATAGVLALYGYDNLGGVSPRLASWNDVVGRISQVMGCEVDATSGAIGTWGNGVALNATFNNWNANKDYALLGYSVNVSCLGVAITGIDTGNLKVGGPGDPDPVFTRTFFRDLSEKTGKPYIPIIAANNAGSTQVQVIDVAGATAVQVSLILGRLD
jgi:hypothetical protein